MRGTKRSCGLRIPILSATFTTLLVNDANLGQANGFSRESPIIDGSLTQSPSCGSMGCRDAAKLFCGRSYSSKLFLSAFLSLNSSTIMAETVSYCSVRPRHQLAYFYFSFNDPQRQKAENCLRTILRQLLLQKPAVPDGVRDVYLKHKYGHAPLAAWKTALGSMIQETMQTLIIIDALDECPTLGGEQAKLLEVLQSLAASKSANLHILVTSRKESDIEEKLIGSVTLPPLSIQGEDTDSDIRTHVKAQLVSDSTMSNWPEPIKLEVEQVLTSKANGM